MCVDSFLLLLPAAAGQQPLHGPVPGGSGLRVEVDHDLALGVAGGLELDGGAVFTVAHQPGCAVTADRLLDILLDGLRPRQRL